MCHSPSHLWRSASSLGLCGVYCSSGSRRRCHLFNLRAELHDGVDRALLRPGDVAGDVDHRLEVLVVDGWVGDALLDGARFAERDVVEAGSASVSGRDSGGSVSRTCIGISSVGRIVVEESRGVPAEAICRCPGEHRRLDAFARPCSRRPIRRLLLGVRHIPVDVHHAFGLSVIFIISRASGLGVVGPIDLRHHRMKHGRSGWNLRHLGYGLPALATFRRRGRICLAIS